MPARQRRAPAASMTVPVEDVSAPPTNIAEMMTGVTVKEINLILGVEMIDELNAMAENIAALEGKRRVASDPSPAKLHRDYEEKYAEYVATQKPFKFRSRKYGDYETVAKELYLAGKKADDPVYLPLCTIAHFSVEPKMSIADVAELKTKIGIIQYEQLQAWLGKLITELQVPPNPKSLRR